MSPELEINQAHIMARAALHADIGHVIWSTFEDSLSAVLNEPVSSQPVPVELIRQSDFPLADDSANMFQFFIDHDEALVNARDVAVCRELHPDLKTFAQWAHENRPRLRVVADGQV